MAKKIEPVKEEVTSAKSLEVKADNPVGQVIDQSELNQMYGDLDRQSVNIPRLVILEQLSPELRDKLGNSGDFFVKSLNENLGRGPIEVVVLMRSMSRMRWKPISDGGGIICQALEGKRGIGDPGGSCATCKLKDWNGPTKPLCDQYENFIIVRRDQLQQGEPFPMAISGSRTRLRGLKDFNTILMQSIQRQRPLFAKSYVVKALEKQNPKIPGSIYHIYQVSVGNNNAVLPDAEQAAAYELFKSFSGKSINIDQEIPGNDAETAAPAGAPAI